MVAGGEDDLVASVEGLILNRRARERQVAAARAVVERYTGAVGRVWEALAPLVARARAGEGA